LTYVYGLSKGMLSIYHTLSSGSINPLTSTMKRQTIIGSNDFIKMLKTNQKVHLIKGVCLIHAVFTRYLKEKLEIIDIIN
jgi:hypothetical protein